jgi:ABC-type multidrug transport system ATPase subunit
MPIDFDRLTAEDVSRHFGRRKALSRISFQTRHGSILGLLGPNGAGKSTMIAVLATLLRPSSGAIRYGSHAAQDAGSELTARENLAFFAGLYDAPDAHAAADRALARAGLADRAHDPISSFSRGMRQRVALERSLIHGPRLVLLDEPFTGLDDASTAALVARLRGLRDEGAIVILATHDLDLAEGLLDEALFLRDGRMLDTVPRPEALRSTYRSIMGTRA